MKENKLKSLYNKVAPMISAIAKIGVIVCALGWLVSGLLENILTEPWPHYYAAVAEQAFTWATIILAVVYIIFDFKRVWARLKEFLRKIAVSLKRKPSIIPLLMLLVSFLVFSLNLTDLSDTTAKIQGKGMGLSQFSIMLFSLLSMVCMLNAFPRRQKPNYFMLVVMFAMFGIIIFCDLYYCQMIMAALTREVSPIVIDPQTQYIALAYNMLNTHVVLVCISAGLVVLLPVYSKLLKKIKTSIAVEDNGSMEALELND